MSGIMVESTTQRIIVNPAISSIGVINTGPMGPTGPTGPAETLTVLDTDGDILTRESGALADITRAALAADTAFSDVYIMKTLFTVDGQILTRVAGVPAPITRASLAADSAFSTLYAPKSAWATFTPTLSGSGWAIGNGTVTGRYKNDDKKVRYRGKITAGSTTTFGGSQLLISLPPSLNAHASTPRCIGSMFIIATNVFLGACSIAASATTMATFGIASATGQLASFVQNAPVTLVNGSTIDWDIEYEAA